MALPIEKMLYKSTPVKGSDPASSKHLYFHGNTSATFHWDIEMQLRSIPLLLGAILPVAQAALRQHTLNLTYATHNADGTTRESWLINGQTPGPHLVWDEGDEVSVKVLNNGHEAATIHWHGIEQVGTPWSDGVPGLTQWPIPPGEDFIYNFTLKQAGFQWYHSHYKMQLDDGLKGTIYIRPKPNKPKPFNQISNKTEVLKKLRDAEKNPFTLNVFDYKHYTSEHWMAEWERTDVEQLCIDNLLTNGKGPVRCPNMTEINAIATPEQKPLTKKGCLQPSNKIMFPYPESRPDTVEPAMWYDCTNSNTTFEVFTVKKSDGWVAFNLLNSGALWDLRVSIDSHKMYFFAADGHYTKIQVATSILIPIGERYQFFVKLDQPVGDYVIRTAAVVLPQLISGYSILSYVKSGKTGTGIVEKYTLPAAKNPYIDYAGNIINGGFDLVQANLAPFPNSPPPQGKADVTIPLNVTRSSEFGWVLNGNSWHEPSDDFTPLLFQPAQVASLDPSVYFSYPNGSVVDLIFTVTAGNPAMHPPHPMHKHGIKAWFLGSGDGPFPYASIQDAVDAGYKGINLKNPPLRDDFVTPVAMTGQAWAAVRFRAVDPGPIILHCHIDAHLATGMVIVLFEGPEKITDDFAPAYYRTKNKP
ncbi:multicopper oxidase [Rhizoctonia solani 123E]|uniref:Multicopper oxidase n=1 Tax=Rhizoctonia solani 123E TaxID=1423351 RepID=A0A074RVT4_9AGAM|nr:multicopper oxidase [Rhizoctonia solani 123E]